MFPGKRHHLMIEDGVQMDGDRDIINKLITTTTFITFITSIITITTITTTTSIVIYPHVAAVVVVDVVVVVVVVDKDSSVRPSIAHILTCTRLNPSTTTTSSRSSP